jgi:hypothetical protein
MASRRRRGRFRQPNLDVYNISWLTVTCLRSRLTKSESRVSWNYDMTSYEAKRLLNLADDTGFEQAATMSENRMAGVSENAWNTSNPGQASSLSRTSSEVSLYMPVRRRSIIQTPGVATRSSPDPEPELPPLPRPNVRYSHPPTPSLSRQHSVESYRSGITSMPPRLEEPESTQRVLTPCEDKYLSIGAFKLGSLRITNGSPPRTPDGGKGQTGNTSQSGQLDALQDGFFPVVQASGTQSRGTDVTAEAEPQARLQYSTHISLPGQPPSEKPRSTSPTLQTTSKPTALEASLFDDDTQPEYSSVEVLDVRLDPNAKSPHSEVSRNSAASSVQRTDSGFVSTITSPASDIPSKSLTKADSGYSSNVSLRSFQSQSQKRESPSEEREPTPPPVPPKDPIWLQANRVKQDGVIRKTPHNLREVQLASPVRSEKQSPHSAQNRGPVSPLHDMRSPTSVKSASSGHSSSVMSVGGTTKKHSRLHRFLSGTRKAVSSVPASQSTIVSGNDSRTPSPQQDLNRKKTKHAVRDPLHAARKLGLRSRPSKETLRTIFSVGSLETKFENGSSSALNARGGPTDTKDGPRKPAAQSIPRKPVPTPKEPASDTTKGYESDSGAASAMATVPTDYSTPIRSPTSRGRNFPRPNAREPPARSVSEIDLSRVSMTLPSPPLPSPVAKALDAESKKAAQPARTTMPPVSLRVPPPLRPNSIASLSRRTSVESLRSHPTGLHSRTSMESMRSYSSNQPRLPNSANLPRPASEVWVSDPRRLDASRHNQSVPSSPYYSEGWEWRMGDGANRPTSQMFDGSTSRRNSITSVHSEGGYYPGAGSSSWSVRTSQPPLRYRASFDNGQPGYYPHPQRGYPPSMSNGYTAKHLYNYSSSQGRFDPASVWVRAQAAAAAGQWYQDGARPPYVPRGRYGSRGAYGYGYHPPYRVLHSYNSPAYRNAPIWS